MKARESWNEALVGVCEPSCELDDVCADAVWPFPAKLASLRSLLNDQFLIAYSMRKTEGHWAFTPYEGCHYLLWSQRGGGAPTERVVLRTVGRYSINMWCMLPKWNWKLSGHSDTCSNIWLCSGHFVTYQVTYQVQTARVRERENTSEMNVVLFQYQRIHLLICHIPAPIIVIV